MKKRSNKYVKNFLIIYCTVGFVFVFSLFCYELFKPQFRIKKYDRIVEYQYKDKFIYHPADICYGNFFSCKDIKSNNNGKVDTSKLGKQTVEYEYSYDDESIVLKQDVIVEDKVKPKIITESNDAYICPNGKLDKITYKAIDNYDNDITDKVEIIYNKKKNLNNKKINNSINGLNIKPKKNKVVLRVIDSNNNKTIKELNAIKKDIKAPILEMNGLTDRNILVGDTYEDEGAKVTDNCDEDIKINVTNDLNTGVAGTYHIVYYAKDSSGNESSVTRTINVKNIESGSKLVYLTFDDGPSEYTNYLLDILKKYNVKATFFVTGHGDDSIIKREFDEGHTVALHTNTHDYSYVYSSVDNYFNDLYAVQSRVRNITGTDSNIIRFPGGSSNTVSKNYDNGSHIMSTLTSEVQRRGFHYFDWNVSSGDAGGTSDTDQVYRNVISSLKDGSSVVLQHDTKKFSIDAVEKIILYCQQNGYIFATLKDNSYGAHHGVNN